MLTARRLNTYVCVLSLLLVILVQQVVAWGWLSDLDESAGNTAKKLRASQDIFSVTVMFGLRGIILTVCLPVLGWLSWKRKSWVPIAGFVLVLLFETGIAGALKIAIGRIFPYQFDDFFYSMLVNVDEKAFPSGHAANSVALWGYMAWYFTCTGTIARRIAVSAVVIASCTVVVSSWLIRTHWPTDLIAGCIIGCIALLGVIGLYTALGLNPEARIHHSPKVHRETADAQ